MVIELEALCLRHVLALGYLKFKKEGKQNSFSESFDMFLFPHVSRQMLWKSPEFLQNSLMWMVFLYPFTGEKKAGGGGEPWEWSVTKFGVYDFYFCYVAWVP